MALIAMDNNIKSHIQTPKGVIKFFEISKKEESPFVWAYDVEKNKIYKAHAKSLNTEKGYYSGEVEEYLSREIEKPYIDLVYKVSKIVARDNYKEYSHLNYYTMNKIVQSYKNALVQRDPDMLKSFEKTEYLKTISSQGRKYYVVEHMIELLKGKDHFDLAICINNTEIPFILTMNGMYSGIDSKNNIIVFISACPNFCFELIQNNNKINRGKNIVQLRYLTSDSINELNKKQSLQQIKRGHGFIACGDKTVLDKLVHNF